MTDLIPEHTKIATIAQMQAIEAGANASGHTYAQMMELAGQATARQAQKMLAELAPGDGPVLILVGPGNNGGDGLVCARFLHQAGIPVRVYLWKRDVAPDQDLDNHYAALGKLGVETYHSAADPDLAQLLAWLQAARLMVDALLGTGSNRPITGQLAQILELAAHTVEARRESAFPLPILAVDCPSGLNCDSGAVDPHTLSAQVTITFAYAKWGHYHFPGPDFLGRLVVADIGIEPQWAADVQTFVLDPGWVRARLPKRPQASHKGSFGKVMAVVGSVNYPGAAYLSCAAAGRVGAGLVTAAVAQPVWAPLASRLAEATYLLLPHEVGVITEQSVAIVESHLPGYHALLLGCGLTQEEPVLDFMRALLTRNEAKSAQEGSSPFTVRAPQAQSGRSRPPLPPTVIDADGLNCLAKINGWSGLLPAQCVLTPHPAEMARLCALPLEEVQARRWELAREKAAAWNCVLLIKGPYTVIAHPDDGRLAVLPVATAALATAGTGDVLAGLIAGLLAQGLSSFDAACVGSLIHGLAGLRCRDVMGEAGVVAGDLLPMIPPVLRELATNWGRWG